MRLVQFPSSKFMSQLLASWNVNFLFYIRYFGTIDFNQIGHPRSFELNNWTHATRKRFETWVKKFLLLMQIW